MSCYTKPYLPNPSRAWARSESLCAQNPSLDPNAPNSFQMIRKANVLQYNKNSYNRTKSENISNISKGINKYNRKSFSSKNNNITDNNTSLLKRINYTTIIAPENTPSASICPDGTIKVGGTLSINAKETPCTNIILKQYPSPGPYTTASTTSSNVPGIPMILYYNNSGVNIVPKKNTRMINSTNKWPTNYTFNNPANQQTTTEMIQSGNPFINS